MPTRKSKTKRGRAQDRRLVSGKQKHEVSHLSRQSGKSPEAVRNAIKTYGHSRGRLMELLKELHEVLNMILPPKKGGKRKRKMPMT